ncbi:MAG: hypothetical protein GY946_18945 [bacterium]|nr:hypothetical protein [bacterium]
MSSMENAAITYRELTSLVLLGALILGSLWPAGRVGLWNGALTKPTILWLLFSGFGLVFSLNEAIANEDFFRNALFRTLGVAALIEFFAALKSFPLWLELPAQLFAFLFAGVAVIARDPEQAPVGGLANGYLILFGFGAVVWSVVAAVRDWD